MEPEIKKPVDLRHEKQSSSISKWAVIKDKMKQPAVYVPTIFILLIIPLITSQIYRYNNAKTNPDPNATPKKAFGFLQNTNEAKTYVSPLDGVRYTDETAANRHALGIMIENHPDARPQFGLTDASIVYEAQAEGGITRFLGIFGPKLPDKVGPVRSARTYYIDWCLEYDCFYAHVGGNIDALDEIPQIGVKDLDQFRYGAKAYGREPHGGVAIEHTMYTNPNKLYDIAQNNKWTTSGNLPGVTFKTDASTKDRPTSQDIEIEISSRQFNTEWQYDPTTNSYARLMAGTPHKDGKTGDQIKSKVVIVQEVVTKNILTRINEQGLAMTTVGSGKARVYQDGVETIGTWSKATQKARTIFYDASGAEIKFNAGQRWVTIVTPGSKVTATTVTTSPTP